MRDSREIKKWLIDAGITVAGIAKELQVSRTLVSLTLTAERNNKNNRRVLRYALDNGCPAHILGLPDDMKEAA